MLLGFILIIVIGFAVSIIITLLILKFFNSTKANAKRDREIIEVLGNEKINYSNPYFTKLTQQEKVGSHLPTRVCDSCGSGIDPEDKFCNNCGFKT